MSTPVRAVDKPSRFPVFVVGSARSGTSILLSTLRTAGYSGFAEGNFLSLISVLDRDVDKHFATFRRDVPQLLMSRIDRDGLKAALARVLVAEVERQQQGGPWVDKTGGAEMIRAIPTLRSILPTSCYIFAKRRAIENIVSRVRKFPAQDFEFHCMAWAQTMTAWRKLRQDHPDTPGMEIDQQDISTAPKAAARRIAAFLDLSPAAELIVEQSFTRNRPQQTAPGSTDRILSLDEVPWSAAEVATFHRHCDAEMAIYGYSCDNTYRVAA